MQMFVLNLAPQGRYVSLTGKWHLIHVYRSSSKQARVCNVMESGHCNQCNPGRITIGHNSTLGKTRTENKPPYVGTELGVDPHRFFDAGGVTMITRRKTLSSSRHAPNNDRDGKHTSPSFAK